MSELVLNVNSLKLSDLARAVYDHFSQEDKSRDLTYVIGDNKVRMMWDSVSDLVSFGVHRKDVDVDYVFFFVLYCECYDDLDRLKSWLERFCEIFEKVGVINDLSLKVKPEFDEVETPKHYNSGGTETQYLIDEFVSKIDNPKLVWRIANTLKYLDRFTLKENPLKDLKKAREYLSMCINILEGEKKDV